MFTAVKETEYGDVGEVAGSVVDTSVPELEKKPRFTDRSATRKPTIGNLHGDNCPYKQGHNIQIIRV